MKSGKQRTCQCRLRLELLIFILDPTTHKFSASVLMMAKHLANKILLSTLNFFVDDALDNRDQPRQPVSGIEALSAKRVLLELPNTPSFRLSVELQSSRREIFGRGMAPIQVRTNTLGSDGGHDRRRARLEAVENFTL